MKWSDLPIGHMAGGLYSPHPAAAIRLRPPGCGVGTGGVGSSMLEASCPPDSLPLSLPLLPPPTPPYKAIFAKAPNKALTHRRQEDAQPQVDDGVPPCVGKMQVVSRHPWVLASSSPTQQGRSTTAATPCCCVGTPGGRLVSRTSGTPRLPREHRQWCLPVGLVRDQC